MMSHSTGTIRRLLHQRPGHRGRPGRYFADVEEAIAAHEVNMAA